jgi:hypothetical protein
VPIHPSSAPIEQNWATEPVGDRSLYGLPHGWQQGHQHNFRALPEHPQDAVAVFLTHVRDVRTTGFEDPQAQQAEHGDHGEVGREEPSRPPRSGDGSWGGGNGDDIFDISNRHWQRVVCLFGNIQSAAEERR